GTTAERLLRQIHKPILVVKNEAATPYQRVLVAVDFSPHSRRALAGGTALAPQGEIHLAHVFEALFEVEMRYASVTEETIQEYRARARAQAEADLQRFIDACGVDDGRLHRSIEQGGHVPTKLLDKAREIGADLVVVGKHGQSLTEALLLGSVTLHLLAACPCDVLVMQ
ncbi:universal stress protein, partial [Arthrospira platensis SPKY1]|nr:universal stress protein [Arthrospira platensis SPKY1]